MVSSRPQSSSTWNRRSSPERPGFTLSLRARRAVSWSVSSGVRSTSAMLVVSTVSVRNPTSRWLPARPESSLSHFLPRAADALPGNVCDRRDPVLFQVLLQRLAKLHEDEPPVGAVMRRSLEHRLPCRSRSGEEVQDDGRLARDRREGQQSPRSAWSASGSRTGCRPLVHGKLRVAPD